MTQNTRDWHLVRADEFDYQGAPDSSKCSFNAWPASKVNDEDQTYSPRAKNVGVENGRPIIQAHKEPFQGAEYSSARIEYLGKGDFLYGKVDVKAKLPAGQGTWSAIWMLPSDPFRYGVNCQASNNWQGNDDWNVIGCGWGRAGGPIDESIFPVHMEVDYVPISQLK